MGKLIHIGEHAVMTPTPKVRGDILFVDDKDAVWDREKAISDYKDIFFDFVPGPLGTRLYQDATLYNQDGVLISLNKEDSDWMIWAYEREFYRRTYGVHFKNGNEIDWLTGDHWFALVWCKAKIHDKQTSWLDYMLYQAWYYQLFWHVEQQKNVSGLAISKAKKTGITNITWLLYLNRATKTKNINLGHMTIDIKKGAKTFIDHFMYAYNGLPPCLQPQIKSKSDTDGRILFGNRLANNRKITRKQIQEEELGTSVMCVPAAINAFDIDVFDITWYDEYPKYTQDFGEIYRSNEEGTAIQDINVGKKLLTSYTPEGDSPSFNSAKDIYLNSELRTRTEHSDGKTGSGLICWHIAAFQSWKSEMDKNGRCREQSAMKKIQIRRDLLKDKPRELLAETRRYANDKREAWMAGGAGSIFDNARLAELLFNIQEEHRIAPILPFKEGRLEWKNKLWETGLKNKRPKGEFCPVEFIPLTDEEIYQSIRGRLLIFDDIPPQLRNEVLKNGKDEHGCLIPPEEFRNVFGADPTQHAAASEVIQGSKNAFVVLSRPDERMDSFAGKVASKIIRMVYLDRPELPGEAYEDLVKLIIYCGCIGIPEANVPAMATNLIEEGLGGFMLVRDEHGTITQWKRWMGLGDEPDKKYKLIRTTANSADTRYILESFVSLWKAYVAKPEVGGKDYGATIGDDRIIEDLMNLDVANTKLHDLFMAGGYALLSEEIYSNLLLHQEDSDISIKQIEAVMNALSVV